MGIIAAVSTEVVKVIAAKVADKALNGSLNTNYFDIKTTISNLPDLLELHLIELINWSCDIPFIGLSTPKDVSMSTIELSISAAITRYDSKSRKHLIDEDELLKLKKSVMLFGLPGAGKTTTLKRIILKYFSNGFEDLSYDFPLLLRFRNLKSDTTIAMSILEILGIQYKIEVVEFKKDNTRSYKRQASVGNMPVETFVPKFLNETNALLILDGLDEAPQDVQDEYLEEIEALQLKLDSANIILTIRKSKFVGLQTKFLKFEIRPLEPEQIKAIAKKWVDDSDGFYNELSSKPYADLGNRPIFLTLLMILYSKYNYLPLQPYEVYREATYLIVKDWDEHRRIIRKSKYADFNTRKKLDMLYEISYYLTYRIKTKIFSSDILEEVFKEIHSKYGFQFEDMDDVIAEIESHNGIISEAGYNEYEFSHLSIQEYLCAEYIVTLPFSQETIIYFYEYPEPLAIAICLSGDPSAWFASLLLNNSFNIGDLSGRYEQRNFHKSLLTLLGRICVESPNFKINNELGAAVVFLLFKVGTIPDFRPIILNLLDLKNVLESLNRYLTFYGIISTNEHSIHIGRNIPVSGNYFVDYPGSGDLPLHFFSKSDFVCVEVTQPGSVSARKKIMIKRNEIAS